MQAIRVAKHGGPDVLQLENVAIPKPKDGQVLVKVFAAGVNPVDIVIREGLFGPKPMPYVPGGDAGGTICAVGDGVLNFQVNSHFIYGG